MPKSTHTTTNFTNGELSPRGLGRFDLAKYGNSAKILENFLIYQLGGALYRPGTVYVAATKNSSKKSRLIPFSFSTSQTYVLEFGDYYIRFFSNSGQLVMTGAPAWIGSGHSYVVGNFVTSGGLQYYCVTANSSGATFAADLALGYWVRQNAYEIPSPYAMADVFDLQYTQDADTMYLVHQSYAPYKLQRLSALYFTLTAVPFVRGPFQDKNVTAASTITPSADTGTAINLVSVNDLFYAGHVGSLWRVKSGVVKITTVTNTKLAIGDVQAEPDGTAGNLATGPGATSDWQEGAFSTYRGFPAAVAFHEQRLIYANTPYQPQSFWGSVIQAYDNFKVPATVTDADSFSFTIASGQVNAIRFISSGPAGIELGTSGGTFSNSSGTATTLTPTNPNVHRDTNVGVAKFIPPRISSYCYFVTSTLFQVLELVYDWLTNREKTTDMNLMADHILRDGDGVVDIALQQYPNDRIWCVRSDGQIAVMTRNPGQDVVGWSRIVAGSDSTGPGLFESISIIQRDGDDDQVWVIVNRTINGSTARYVEYFTSEFFTNYYDPVRLDCSLSYDVPVDISGATKADPVVITTSTAHGFILGDKVKIDNVGGMTDLNTNIYVVTSPTAFSFQLYDENGNPIDGTSFGTYETGGEVRKMVTHFTGLDHLEGETVSVQTDGGIPATQQKYIVSSGAITLKNPAATVHVGLPYVGTMQLLKLSGGSQQTGQTKTRRIYQTTLRVFDSLGCEVGQDLNHMQTKYFGTPNTPLGHVPTLVTGDFDIFPDTWWDRAAEPIIMQTQPLPLFILAVVIRSEVEEK